MGKKAADLREGSVRPPSAVSVLRSAHKLVLDLRGRSDLLEKQCDDFLAAVKMHKDISFQILRCSTHTYICK
jgi:hypothetical protein